MAHKQSYLENTAANFRQNAICRVDQLSMLAKNEPNDKDFVPFAFSRGPSGLHSHRVDMTLSDGFPFRHVLR